MTASRSALTPHLLPCPSEQHSCPQTHRGAATTPLSPQGHHPAAPSDPGVTHPSPAQPATDPPLQPPDSTGLNAAAPRRGSVLQRINPGGVYPSPRWERSLCTPTPCRPEHEGRELHHPKASLALLLLLFPLQTQLEKAASPKDIPNGVPVPCRTGTAEPQPLQRRCQDTCPPWTPLE